MDLITGIILGVLQGLTEFLPISSSGHLVLAERVLGGKVSTGLVFEVMVHFATMIAVVIYFRKKIVKILGDLLPPYTDEKRAGQKLAGIIIIGTIPAAAIGLVLEDRIEHAFGSAWFASLMLIVTAGILFSTRLIKHGDKNMGLGSGFLVGLAQAAALLPGISRSGTTISAGLHLKIAPAVAAEFSFLLSLPAVFGATVLKSFDLAAEPVSGATMLVYLAGALAALIVGYLSIAWLMSLVKKGQFFYFGIYCLVVGMAGIIWL